jgi:outer membrane protein
MNRYHISSHFNAWRRTVLPSLVALLLVPGLQAQGKIGLVDLKKVFDGYYKTKQADTQLKERAADLDKARKGMMEDYDKAKEEFEKVQQAATDQALSADEREKRKAAAQKKLMEIKQIEQDITQFDRTSRSTLAEQQRRMRDRIMDSIKEVVAAKAKEKGFFLVLDTAAESANQTAVILFHTGENEVTDLVLGELNSRTSVDLPVPADKPAEKPADKKDDKTPAKDAK